VPLIQRLDGIFYNTDTKYGDWWNQNKRIFDTYECASGIIFQSQFSKDLVEAFFGAKHQDVVTIINNGVDLLEIAKIKRDDSPELDRFDDVWVTASSWRPHKRL